MTKILVTGGAGFIGSHIVDALKSSTELGQPRIEVVDDLSSGSKENLPEGVELHKLDIGSVEARRLFSISSPDIIVHAAAQISVRISMEDPWLDTKVNVLGLLNILQAFQGRKLPYFIFISTGGAIYGEQESFPAPESHQIKPESVYGLSKYVSERYLDLWRRQFSLKHSVLRLSNVYGPRQNPHGEAGVVAIFCQRLLRGQEALINGTGDQSRDFIFVKDVAKAVKMCCEKKVQGCFNIGTGTETSINKLYDLLTQACGISRHAKYGAAKGGEQMRSVIDSSLASRTFGWRAEVDLRSGLRETADWFRKAEDK